MSNKKAGNNKPAQKAVVKDNDKEKLQFVTEVIKVEADLKLANQLLDKIFEGAEPGDGIEDKMLENSKLHEKMLDIILRQPEEISRIFEEQKDEDARGRAKVYKDMYKTILASSKSLIAFWQNFIDTAKKTHLRQQQEEFAKMLNMKEKGGIVDTGI